MNLYRIERHNKKIETRYKARVSFHSDKVPFYLDITCCAKNEHDAHVEIYKIVRDVMREFRRDFGYNGFVFDYDVTNLEKLEQLN